MKLPVLEWDRGVRLAGSILWFDAARRDVLSFVSSARLPGATRLRQVICSDRTRTLLRCARRDFQALVAPGGRPVSLGTLRLRSLPSGAMPGAAQARVETVDGSLLYAADVFDDPLPGAEAAEVLPADVLVVDATYGRAGDCLPARADALGRLVETARAALDGGRTPVVLCPPVGPAQAVVRALGCAGMPVRAHRAIAGWNEAYGVVGAGPGPAASFRGGIRAGEVLVWPVGLRGSPLLAGIPRPWFVLASGAATRADVLARSRADLGIPLADHPDRAALDRLVEQAGARVVYAMGRAAGEFAADLRGRGLEAHALHGETQLDLGL